MAAAAADRLDKETSKGIFHLELPWTGELCLTIPAQFCGMPVSALTVGPLIVASVATPSFPLACCAGLVFVVLASCWATLLIKKGVRDGADQMLSSPTGVLVAPLVTVAALSQPQLWGGDAIEGAAAFSAGSFSCTCYFASQLLVASIKWTTLRRRPIHLGCARQLELDAVDRFFVLAAESKYIGVGLATFESFPSGDSCQASQWATLLWLLCTSTPVHCLIALATDLEHSGIRVCTELREVCHLLQPVTLSWIMAGRVTIHSPASRSCSGD